MIKSYFLLFVLMWLVMIRASAQVSGHEAVCTSNQEATTAAKEILNSGGNAVDAAVAAMLTLTVVQTQSVSVAGYGGSMVTYLSKTKKVRALDFDCTVPKEFKYDGTGKDYQTGYKSIGVPGVVAGLYKALAQYGTLPWKKVSAHAYALAENGIPVTAKTIASLQAFVKVADPASVRAYLPHGIPREGQIWKQKDLADIIKQIGIKGDAYFYKGKLARKMSAYIRANGGFISYADFAGYQAKNVAPLHVHWSDYDIYTPPVPSAGITTLSIFKTLATAYHSYPVRLDSTYYYQLAAVSRISWRERFHLLSDPDFNTFRAEELLSDAATKARLLKSQQPIDDTDPDTIKEGLHTVNIVVLDKHGNLVSITATQGNRYGSGVVIPGTGLVFGHGISRFDFDKPYSPNNPQPGKRVMHNMAPLIVLKKGKPYIGLGMPGGRYIETVSAQLLLDLLVNGDSPAEALHIPLLHNEGNNVVQLSKTINPEIVNYLTEKGFKIKYSDQFGGPANILRLNADLSTVEAASTADKSCVYYK